MTTALMEAFWAYEDVRAVDVEAGLHALEHAVLEVAAAVEDRT